MEYGQHNELVAEHHLFNNGRDYGNTFSSELIGKYLFMRQVRKLYLFCLKKYMGLPDVGSVAPHDMSISCASLCVLVTNMEVNWQPTPGPLTVSCFLGDGWLSVCPYLLSPAHGKSALVWRDFLSADCAFNCLICVEVAVDLTGPLLLWSWNI